MPDRQNANFIAGNHKPVHRDVSGVAVGNDQFAYVPFHPPPYQGMSSKIVDCGLDRGDSTVCGIRDFLPEKCEGAFDVIESPL
jgi:hypothetical protein